jgi:hypothetical protein
MRASRHRRQQPERALQVALVQHLKLRRTDAPTATAALLLVARPGSGGV